MERPDLRLKRGEVCGPSFDKQKPLLIITDNPLPAVNGADWVDNINARGEPFPNESRGDPLRLGRRAGSDEY